MIRKSVCALAGALFAGQAVRADLTIRHSFEIKFGAFLPVTAGDAIKKQIGSSFPTETTVHVKGDKVHSTYGGLTSLTDYSKGTITLTNPQTKQYATVALDDFAAKLSATQRMPVMPRAAQQTLENMKFDVQTKKTGQVAMLHGMRAEESVIVLSIEMPAPQGVSAGFRLEMHNWTATADEISRVPALKELATYTARAKSAFNPADLLRTIFSQLPGIGEKLGGPVQELMKSSGAMVLKMEGGLYVPMMAQLAQMQRAGQDAPPGFDPNGPMAEIRMDLAEISTGPVPDAVFDVPADYQSAPIEELLKAVMPAPGSPVAPVPK